MNCPAMKWLMLLPVALTLAACEVGHIKMPMAPMTLGPADGSCTDASGSACPKQALQKGQ